MTLNLTAREVLLQLLGGEDMLIKGEKDFKLVKSADGLKSYDLGEDYEDLSDVVGYITSSERLFIIRKGNNGIYYGESCHEVKPGNWMPLEHYEYSKQYIESDEELGKCTELLQGVFG